MLEIKVSGTCGPQLEELAALTEMAAKRADIEARVRESVDGSGLGVYREPVVASGSGVVIGGTPTVTGIANALLAAQGKEPLSGQLIDAQVDGNPALVDTLTGVTYVQLLIGSATLVGSDGRPMLSRMA